MKCLICRKVGLRLHFLTGVIYGELRRTLQDGLPRNNAGPS
jgi:hypothetical protein